MVGGGKGGRQGVRHRKRKGEGREGDRERDMARGRA